MLGMLVAFLAVSAVVICTPGQDTALTIRSTLEGGRRSGIATAAGVALGQAVWTLAASVGVVAVLSTSEPAFRTLKLAGAAYLVYLGAQSLSSALRGKPHADLDTRRGGLHPRRALRQGLLSNLGNPKMAVFFTSLLPQFAADGSFAALFALGMLFCALTFGWLTLYALAVARARQLIGARARRVLDAVTGFVLMAFGVRLATERG